MTRLKALMIVLLILGVSASGGHLLLHAMAEPQSQRLDEREQPQPAKNDRAPEAVRTRDRAATELRRLGEQALPALHAALAKPASLEAQRRVESLLARLRPPLTASARLQSLRAVQLLERIDSPAARTVLKKLTDGAPHARGTREAKDALTRLERRRD
jgi:hypothetical protein